MEKKKGNICIVNRAIFTTDDNHPVGFTIPVNTRLIIDAISKNYFRCTLDSGYKTSIKLEHDCSLTIITDNKKINKFKQQLAENNNSTIEELNLDTCDFADILNAIIRLDKLSNELQQTTDEGELCTKDKLYLKKLVDEKNKRILNSKTEEELYNSKIEKSKSKIVRTQTMTIKVDHLEDGGFNVYRTNDGFNSMELLGQIDFMAREIVKQLSGDIKPDIVKRTVIVD